MDCWGDWLEGSPSPDGGQPATCYRPQAYQAFLEQQAEEARLNAELASEEED